MKTQRVPSPEHWAALQHAAQGMSNEEIAEALTIDDGVEISINTVISYLDVVSAYYGTSERSAMAVRSIVSGAIAPPACRVNLIAVPDEELRLLSFLALGLSRKAIIDRSGLSLNQYAYQQRRLAQHLGLPNNGVLLAAVGVREALRAHFMAKGLLSHKAARPTRPTETGPDPKHLAVASMALCGYSDRQIALHLGVSVYDVDEAFAVFAKATGVEERPRQLMILLGLNLITHPRMQTTNAKIPSELGMIAACLAHGHAVETIASRLSLDLHSVELGIRRIAALLGIPARPILVGAIIRRDQLITPMQYQKAA